MNNLHRQLATPLPDHVKINFASNDYLGLADNHTLKQKMAEAVLQYGMGGKSSRLLYTAHNLYEIAEQKLAKFINQPKTLILGSGYSLNVSLYSALHSYYQQQRNKPVLFLLDKLVHASIIDGVLLSGSKFIRYKHNNYQHLEALLNKYSQAHTCVVVTETLFSMDGDQPDFMILQSLKDQYGFLLCVDEAHSFGIIDSIGKPLIDISIATFGKAFGLYGACVGINQSLHHYLVNKQRGLIYSTALPPAVIHMIPHIIDYLIGVNGKTLRARLSRNSHLLREMLLKIASNSDKAVKMKATANKHIIPLVLGDDSDGQGIFKKLLEQGIYVRLIKKPSVESTRFRLATSSQLSVKDINQTYGAMRIALEE